MDATLPSLPNLAAALVAAQKDLQDPLKNKTADVKSDRAAYKYQYADLAQVYQTLRPVLSKHGLALSHTAAVAEGRIVVETHLVHSSGESLSTTLSWPCPPDIQKLGSAITYLKRYGVGLVTATASDVDDDDGAGTSAPPAAKKSAPREEPPPAPEPSAEQRAEERPYDDPRAELAAEFDRRLKALYPNGLLKPDLEDAQKGVFKVADFGELTPDAAKDWLKKLKRTPDARLKELVDAAIVPI